jgi:hypothetical protein
LISLRYLADEDLRNAIVRATLRMQPKLEFTTVSDEGLGGSDDESVLAFASNNGCIVVSHDVNTMRAETEIRIARNRGMPGLFLVPQSRPTRAVAESLVLIWSASRSEEWENRIEYLPI